MPSDAPDISAGGWNGRNWLLTPQCWEMRSSLAAAEERPGEERLSEVEETSADAVLQEKADIVPILTKLSTSANRRLPQYLAPSLFRLKTVFVTGDVKEQRVAVAMSHSEALSRLTLRDVTSEMIKLAPEGDWQVRRNWTPATCATMIGRVGARRMAVFPGRRV